MPRPGRTYLSFRFARYLLREFRFALCVFWGLVLVGGWMVYRFHEHSVDYWRACYEVFLLIFLNPQIEFPEDWRLRVAFFLLPVIGLGAVADSFVRMGYLVFAKKSNLPEWHRMAASLYRDHIIVLGVGKVGYRIIKGLLELNESVVAIERSSDALLLDDVVDRGVPVIRGDGRLTKTLNEAGVMRARAIILATSNDLANLDVALTARDVNPQIKVVVRLFDDTLADKFAGAFAMPAISTAKVAAPAFIAAATGRRIYQEFELAGKPVHLTDIRISAAGSLAGRSVGQVQAEHGVNILMHSGPNGVAINPGHDDGLAAGDTILVMAPNVLLVKLDQSNQTQNGGAPMNVPSPHQSAAARDNRS